MLMAESPVVVVAAVKNVQLDVVFVAVMYLNCPYQPLSTEKEPRRTKKPSLYLSTVSV